MQQSEKQYTDPKPCEHCGTEFQILIAYRHGNTWIKRWGAIRKQVYCSADCRDKARYQRIKQKKLAYNKERYLAFKEVCKTETEDKWIDV